MDRIEAQVQVQGETSRLVFNQSTREFQFENVEVESAPYSYRFKFSMQNLMAFAGPGWVMSLAYIDPGNLEADLQQGAYTNCRLLWVLWWSTVAGLLLQELSSRLGVVTGRDLATVAKAAYPRRTSLALYAMMELAIIGSDVQEVRLDFFLPIIKYIRTFLPSSAGGWFSNCISLVIWMASMGWLHCDRP